MSADSVTSHLPTAARVACQISTSLDLARHFSAPFDYWLVSEILPDQVIERIGELPFSAPRSPNFDGRRESNNSSRIFFSPKNQALHPVCEIVADAFSTESIVDALGQMAGRNLQTDKLRIEYCQDADGFWLEPHRDIAAKKITMLVYLSDDPNLTDVGTDIYGGPPEQKLVARVPYAKNSGLIFAPGSKTWHGLSRRPIRGLRRTLIVNFVSSEWRQTNELAFP